VTPIACLFDGRIAAWVDAKLLGFVDVYLQLQTHDQYQKSYEETEPACGMQIG